MIYAACHVCAEPATRWVDDGHTPVCPDHDDTTDFVCEAYGPEGVAVGAVCFLTEVGRVCDTAATCHTEMVTERQRVFRTINELAAGGDPVMGHLAAEFTAPNELLNAADDDA